MIMEKKSLILKNDGNDLFFKEYENVQNYFWKKNLLFKIMKKIGLPLNYYLGSWKRDLNNIDSVIFFDNGYNSQVSKYIKKKNKNIRCIFWYWNSIIEYNNKLIEDPNIDEIWTYNRFDANKFNLKYNPQFYNCINQEYIITPKLNDSKSAIYLGRNKGRIDEINSVKKMLESKDVLCDFIVIENESNTIEYSEYLKKIQNIDIIVDISINVSSGLSLRPLEALFYKKKLITNNQDIINYNFYNKNNIFILGLDNEDNLDEFLSSNYCEINSNIIEYYSFEKWLERILNNKE